MNYEKHYNALISRARSRVLEEYTERHHILPRCMGGDDNLSNLVQLTPEEHYVAHQLLIKLYPDNRNIVFAAGMMGGTRSTNKLYGWLRKKMSASMKGRKFSQETLEKMRVAKQGYVPWNKGIKTNVATAGCFKKGNTPWNLNRAAYTKMIEINGTIYQSRKEAAERLGKDMTTIMRWLKNGKAVDKGIV